MPTAMELIQDHIPAALTLAGGALLIILLRVYAQRSNSDDNKALILQLLMWAAALALLVAVLIALPLSDSVRGQILSLIGVVISAIIALSSTTFVSNAMAGIMLQATQPFRPGDFIQVNGVFGRVTHRALVHTRVQTETRDFTSLPNLMLVTHPITVMHREGTIIHADVSLGYDVHHLQAEARLTEAAADAGLDEPYVLITDLFDHAVNYRVAGFLTDVRSPLSARSTLRRRVLDALHSANIEITSPSVVAQRQQPGDTRAMPSAVVAPRAPSNITPEERIFDSADAAALLEREREEIAQTRSAIEAQQALLKKLPKEALPAEEVTLARLNQKLAWLQSKRDSESDA